MAEIKKETYLDLLKNPKWQQKRLQILERDKFKCQDCGDDESTLHVHHKIYYSDRKPWEYKDSELITLCEGCHEWETESLKFESKELLNSFKKSAFLSRNCKDLYLTIENMPICYAPEVTSSAIKWFLSDRDMVDTMVEMFFKSLEKK